MTELTRPVSRLTKKLDRNRPIIVTLAPAGSQDDAKAAARKQGIPWRRAKKKFNEENSI